jgi:glycosyltransferase involved in cell wall biosynthesis
MKIEIVFQFTEGPWGGANQFLKVLRENLMSKGVYVSDQDSASVILLSMNPTESILNKLRHTVSIKRKVQNTIVVARLVGSLSSYREDGDIMDKVIYRFIRIVADGVIYQSRWSKSSHMQLGDSYKGYSRIITNVADSSIFNRKGKIPFESNRKTRLIAVSWSSNWKKGFHIYKWLDEHIDLLKYEMVFIGRSPVGFKNIQHIAPLSSKDLAAQLKQCDIYITASQDEACSNSLIEALQCGLPAIVLNDGGHPEIVGKGGETFSAPEEIPILLDRIVNRYEIYQRNIDLPTVEGVSDEYLNFMKMIYEKRQVGEYKPREINTCSLCLINISFILYEVCIRLRSFKKSVKRRFGNACRHISDKKYMVCES